MAPSLAMHLDCSAKSLVGFVLEDACVGGLELLYMLLEGRCLLDWVLYKLDCLQTNRLEKLREVVDRAIPHRSE